MGNESLNAYYTQHGAIAKLLEQNADILLTTPLIVDASAGDGAFVKAIRERCKGEGLKPPRAFQSDILSREANVRQLDALKTTAADIGGRTGGVYGFNPPFGYRCALARKLIDHAISIQRPEFISVILPTTSGARLIFPAYKLLRKQPMERNAFYDPQTGKPFDFQTSFFVWQRQADGSTDVVQKVTNTSPFVRKIISRFEPSRIPESGPLIVVRRVGTSCGKNGYVRYKDKWFAYRFGTIDWKTVIPQPAPNEQFLTIVLQSIDKNRIEQMTKALCDGRTHHRTFSVASSYCLSILNGLN